MHFLGMALRGYRRQAQGAKGKPLVLEKDMYACIERWAKAKGSLYIRVDTVRQQGFPDILLLNRARNLLIECKLCRNKTINLAALGWQIGQTAFALQCWRGGVNYTLAVGLADSITIYGATHHDDIPDNPYFAELI